MADQKSKNGSTSNKKKRHRTAFDKFMDDQLKREQKNHQKYQDMVDAGETPQQKYNKLYRENPVNRTVWGKK
jgi:hypothetical protein